MPIRAVLFLCVLALPASGAAESAADAVKRIRSQPHSSMPPPERARATGAEGKGMTIENGTGHTLVVHFDGPVAKSVRVDDGRSADVALAVGDYDVAGEVPGSASAPSTASRRTSRIRTTGSSSTCRRAPVDRAAAS
jgi:hypothetical protein